MLYWWLIGQINISLLIENKMETAFHFICKDFLAYKYDTQRDPHSKDRGYKMFNYGKVYQSSGDAPKLRTSSIKSKK